MNIFKNQTFHFDTGCNTNMCKQKRGGCVYEVIKTVVIPYRYRMQISWPESNSYARPPCIIEYLSRKKIA